MTPAIIAAYDISPQAWRNGGGQTRELWTWPTQGPWQLRISRADISADGPFSAFPGVTRWFAVLHGNGVALTLDGQRHTVRTTGDAMCFDGAQAPECQLLDGPTQDLNLMTVGGTSVLQRMVPGQPWTASWTMRGLYTTVSGDWHRAGQEAMPVDAHSLLWLQQADVGAWTFHPAPDADGNAWWLGFTPKE